MKTRFGLLLTFLCFGFPTLLPACLWDADTLADEKKSHPTMAAAILGNPPDLGDPAKLRKRIAELNAKRRENDPAWWNDLAGAHIRLGESKRAAELLESVIARFHDDYGVHANLGTAYHLLGRYAEAEKEIARDLEINPEAHFGLEKYHLALLQYLVRDAKYQSRHVYVDEFTAGFFDARHGLFYFTEATEAIYRELAEAYTNGVAEAEEEYDSLQKTNASEYILNQQLRTIAALDPPPDYRTKWNLVKDTKLDEGVIYMATLNPKEPACFVMLGIVSWKHHDLNLAAAAFEKAVQLGSSQAELLTPKIQAIREHIRKARTYQLEQLAPFIIVSACIIAIGAILLLRACRRRINRKLSADH